MGEIGRGNFGSKLYNLLVHLIWLVYYKMFISLGVNKMLHIKTSTVSAHFLKVLLMTLFVIKLS